MTFPILGGNGAGAEQYLIDNSLRLNSSDSAFLKRTNSTAGNRQKWTFSTWVKLTEKKDGNVLIYPHGASNNLVNLAFSSGTIYMDIGGVGRMFQTNAVFRDVSAWYHIVVAFNTTDYSTVSAGQVRVYVNGVEQTFSNTTNMSVGFNSAMNDAVDVGIGRDEGADNNYADHYLAETYLIDGQQLSPTDFGEFDEDSGIWKPIEYTGTYGTNGFYLDFENSGSLGADQSGNGNNFTPTNLASTDQTTDTPTNNFATLNSTLGSGLTLSEGNTQVTVGGTTPRAAASTFSLNTGKWYCEVKITATAAGATLVGVEADDFSQNSNVYGNADDVYYINDGNKYVDATITSYGASYTTNDIIGIALNLDDDEITFYKNGASQGTITTKTFDGGYYFIGAHGSSVDSSGYNFNFGNPSFSIASGNSDDNGYGNFEYSVPSGYLALCTQNLATALSPTIDDGSQYFNTVLYTGDGSNPRSLTGVGFQPDFTWIKNRTDAWGHGLADSTRGGGKTLITNSTAVEQTNYTWGYVNSFDSDGFTVTNGASGDDFVNQTSDNYASWNWLANGGTTSSNTDGSITSTVQANTTAGFSIVTYTGTGANATIGHGLGVAPKMIICKQRNNTLAHDWLVYHEGIGNTKYLALSSTASAGTASTAWQNTTPTSSVFSVGTSASVNESGKNQLAYCFAEIEGYSKFGSYTGNGSTDGTFVYTGFRPQWVMVKGATTAQVWSMRDNKRDSYNSAQKAIYANLSDAESNNANNSIDLLSNGFKIRNLFGTENSSGQTYIYMAFAESPFVSSSGVPVVAR